MWEGQDVLSGTAFSFIISEEARVSQSLMYLPPNMSVCSEWRSELPLSFMGLGNQNFDGNSNVPSVHCLVLFSHQ